MKHIVSSVVLTLGFCIFLSGCGGKKGKDLPEDTPWNHGISAIMETDLGWYTTGTDEEICLRYYDKESGDFIILCNKPECEHNCDDTCEATYRNLKVVNACLYEGYIYLLGWEGVCNDTYKERDIPETEIADHISLGLYRAALDGSAIDKVATVFETDNIQHQKVNQSRRTAAILNHDHDDTSFIIHKGIAYIPVYLMLGNGSAGLRGAGFYQVDLSTGAVKELEKYETLQSSAPAYLYGVSDYVYYYRYDAGARRQLWYRYVISEDRVEAADPKFYKTEEQNEIFGKSFIDLGAPAVFTEGREYFLVRTYQGKDAGNLSILAIDANTQVILPKESFETEIEFNKRKYQFNPRNNGYYSLTYYDGRFFISDVEKVYVYNLKGTKNGEVTIPHETLKWKDAEKQIRLDFKISDEKLYLIYGTNSAGNGGGTDYYHRVLFCPLSEVYHGQGEWTNAYRIQGRLTFKEYLLQIAERQLNSLSEENRKLIGGIVTDWLQKYYSEEFEDDY
jgi:hypothetical protein